MWPEIASKSDALPVVSKSADVLRILQYRMIIFLDSAAALLSQSSEQHQNQ